MLPDYFFEVAASSTGKYHPPYTVGSGGLVRHTKAAVAIAYELFNLEMYGRYTQDERDLIIASLILHDGMKYGIEKNRFTVAEHPIVVANWIRENSELNNLISSEQLEILCNAISSHMGQWNTDYKTKKEILPKPKTALQKFVHQCDYLASRKYLEFNFGDDYYKPENYTINDKQNENDEIPVDELKETISKIIDVCKAKIKNGVDKNIIYGIIKDKSKESKNPNSIKNVDIAKEILNELEELCVE